MIGKDVEKLKARVEKLEHESAAQNQRLTTAETDIEELKRKLNALSSIKGGDSSNIDTT